MPSTPTGTRVAPQERRERYNRFIPLLGFHHLLMIINSVSVLIWSIILAGCSTTGLNDVYIVSLSYKQPTVTPEHGLQLNSDTGPLIINQVNQSNNTIKRVNVGYFAFCVLPDTETWICDDDLTNVADILRRSSSSDPLNTLWLANSLRQSVFFPGLIIAGLVLALIATAGLATFPGWHKEENSNGSERDVKPFPSAPVSRWCAALTGLAAGLFHVSAFWQHVSIAAVISTASILTYEAIEVKVGSVAIALGWTSAFLTSISFLGLVIMILSIRVLVQLAN